MNWKEFLKPTKWKIILFLLSFTFSSWFLQGIPVNFFDVYACKGMNCPVYSNFSPIFFLLDVIFWYIVCCLMFWIYDKVKKKK
jgi:thiamine transporter ThiT